MRLLLVEDNPGDARLVALALAEAAGDEAELARVDRLAAALDRLDGERWDAVLLDLSLPDSQGIATVRRVRAAAPTVPIVVLTGLTDEDAAMQALHEGAQDYLPKGTDGAWVVRALRYAIERSRTELARQRAERRYRELFDDAPVMYVVTRHEPAGPVVVDCNRLFTQSLGYDRAEVIGRPVAAFYAAESRQHLAGLRDFALAVATGSSTGERRLQTRDGRVIDTVMQLRAERDPDGSVWGALATFVDISARKRGEAELRAAKEAADAANRAKSRFLSMVSHDVRTPLTAVVGYADLLEEGLFGPLNEGQADAVAQISASADRLLDLLDQVLDLSRIEADRLELAPEPVDLLELLGTIRLEFAARAAAKGIGLVVEAPAALPKIEADPLRLRQIFLNLVGNAVKFTERGGVRIRAHAAAGRVEVAVVDTGVGISREVLPQVFDEYAQGGPGTTASYGGTGLGLAIARRLVELHGGTIGVESRSGAGSTFTVVLPLPPGADPAATEEATAMANR
jgi:PAS domain S-box-containing protein